MNTQYTVAQIEANGVQASGTFYGTHRQGWIMDMVHFVDYAGYAQLVIPVEEATDLVLGDWSQRTTEIDMLHAVIQFNRGVQFPRFAMKQGEKWGFVVFRKWADAVKAIQAGERFAFAGGQCLAEDVDLVYLGPGNEEYSRAAGYIQ
jgi:hypothetical protein